MLSSWFNQKASDDGTIDGTTSRPSFASPVLPQAPPRQSTDKPSKRTFPTAYTTPHDTILSELHGTSSQRPNAPDISQRPASCRSEQEPDFTESIRAQVQSPTRSEGNLLAPMPNISFPTSSRASSAASSDLLLDPFDGMALGVLIPRHASADNDGEVSPSPFNLPSTFDGPANTSSVGNEAVWNHLSRILDLQSQISKKHLEMENIGTAKGGDTKRKGHKLGGKNGVEPSNPAAAPSGLGLEDPLMPPGLPGRQRTTSTISAMSSSDEHDHEEGVNVPSEEAEKARIREDEFAKLSSQFEGRKEAINDIMSKLDELSKALSQFHDLPSPNIEFSASRQNSAGVTSPPPASSSPPSQLKGDIKTPRPLSQNVSPDLNQAYDWPKQIAASSSTAQTPVVTVGHGNDVPFVFKPAPQKSIPEKSVVPTVLVNSKDPQDPIHDSPASIGSLKLS